MKNKYLDNYSKDDEYVRINQDENFQYGTFLNGILYTSVFALILSILCFMINDTWFDYTITYIIILLLSIVFFVSGIKKVNKRRIGYLFKLGKPNFNDLYPQGIYWVFPLWKIEEKPDFNVLSEKEIMKSVFYTTDSIPLHIEMPYYWKSKDIKTMYESNQPSVVKDAMESEISTFIQKRHSIEILADEDLSERMMVRCVEKAADCIGIRVTNLYPVIKYDSRFIPIKEEYRNKYFELEYNIKQLLIKKTSMEIDTMQIQKCVKDLNMSNADAINYLKVFKNKVNMNEKTINLNLGELNSVLESIISIFKK